MTQSILRIIKFFLTWFKPSVLLSIALLVAGTMGYHQYQESKYWKGAANDLELRDKERAKIVISKNRIITKFRTVSNGTDKVSTTTAYIPPESDKTVIIIPTDPSKPIHVDVRTFGFRFIPGMAGIYAHRSWQPGVDVKYFYWNRYGLEGGIFSKGVGVGGSRHIDDVPRMLGFKNFEPQNLELYLGYQWTWEQIALSKREDQGSNIFIGVRTNF